MICMFCYDELTQVAHPAGDIRFKILVCRGCRSDYYTVHRELYQVKDDVKLYDQIQIDEFIVTRYYQPTPANPKTNYSRIYKDSLGIVESSSGVTPIGPIDRIGKHLPVCELDHIVKLSYDDLGALKRKIKLWTTFS